MKVLLRYVVEEDNVAGDDGCYNREGYFGLVIVVLLFLIY